MRCRLAVFLIAGSLAFLARGAPAEAQATVYQVLGMTSTGSAADAANIATNKIQLWVKQGWVPVNISSADMFPFLLNAQAGDGGNPVYSVQGAKQWDIYVLLSCTPKTGHPFCPRPLPLPGP